MIFSAGYVKQIISHLPDFIITEFTKRIHNQTVSKGKPDGKKQFVLLKEIIEMSWKTISMKSNIKTLRDAQPNSSSSSRNKSTHVADVQCDPEGDYGETYHQATTANKLYFPCPIHKKDSHELGECKLFLAANNYNRKQLCMKNRMC